VPRHARIVFPDVPHHVTQRGNNRERVFFNRGDYMAYLALLREHAGQFAIEIIAYCLMPNHVHLVLLPSDRNGLHFALKAVHGQYAQRVNRMRDQKGHLWQGRYFSSPLDAEYLLNAVRYVELNPVRARMVSKAEDYAWSSAPAHCGLCNDSLVDRQPRSKSFSAIVDWSQWLAEKVTEEAFSILRQHGSQNLPCGSTEFVTQLERVARRKLRFRAPGRQPNPDSKTANGLEPKGNARLKSERPLWEKWGRPPQR
jgi:putative transposase